MLYAGLFFYHFTLDQVVGLALVLTLNGYDVKKNWRRLLLAGVILGAANVPIFGLPQALRTVSWMTVTFAVLKTGFGFSASRTFLVLFTCLITMPVVWTSCFILRYGFNLTIQDYFASLPLRLLFPLSYNTLLAILAFVSYRRRWRIFGEADEVKIPLEAALPPAVQVVLLGIILNEFLFSQTFSQTPCGLPPGKTEFVTLFLMSVPWFLSMFFLWRILQVAEQEAAVAAQEKLALELRRQTDTLRAQRHDFVNHVQVMLALLRDDRKEELVRYVTGIRREL